MESNTDEETTKLRKRKRKPQPDDPTKKRGYLMDKTIQQAKELKKQRTIIPSILPTDFGNKTSFAEELSKIEEDLYGKSSSTKK